MVGPKRWVTMLCLGLWNYLEHLTSNVGEVTDYAVAT